VNPRLFPDQVAWIVNDAEDRYVFFDVTFLKLVEAHRAALPEVRGWVANDRSRPHAGIGAGAPVLRRDPRLGDERFDWPEIDEDTASSLCYTSGTTGNPKGALYSHRSTLLHSFAVCMPGRLPPVGARSDPAGGADVPRQRLGIPYARAMAGSKLVMPGPNLDGASLFELFESEKVTWHGGRSHRCGSRCSLHMEKNRLTPSTLKRVVIGGGAAPPSMIRAFRERHGVEVLHAWGMTELTRPLGTVNHFKAHHTPRGRGGARRAARKAGPPALRHRPAHRRKRRVRRRPRRAAFGDLQAAATGSSRAISAIGRRRARRRLVRHGRRAHPSTRRAT
jgi:fatty-acyl-CoA synthase